MDNETKSVSVANVIKGPWQPPPHCRLCSKSDGRAVMHESGFLACYDCVSELYFTAVKHETALRQAARASEEVA